MRKKSETIISGRPRFFDRTVPRLYINNLTLNITLDNPHRCRATTATSASSCLPKRIPLQAAGSSPPSRTGRVRTANIASDVARLCANNDNYVSYTGLHSSVLWWIRAFTFCVWWLTSVVKCWRLWRSCGWLIWKFVFFEG